MTKPGLSHATQPRPILPRQLPGLSRVDAAPGTGWLARYYAIGQVHQQLFSDSRYGYNPARSRAAACCWLLACSETIAPRPRFRSIARSNTGLVGICRRVKRERSGAQVLVYDVSYQREGKRCAKIFRVHHYASESAALLAATAFRRVCEREMQGARIHALRQAWAQIPPRKEKEQRHADGGA